MKTISAAERQRLYRQRRDADPARRQAYLPKEKESLFSCWFFLEDILSAIEEPKAVGSRHVQIDPDIWEKLN